MLKRLISAPAVALLLGAILALPTLGHAQRSDNYVAPRRRVGDGKPDICGTWLAIGPGHLDPFIHSQAAGPVEKLGAMFFVPPGLGVVEGDEIPYQPWALERKKHNFANRLVVKDLSNHDYGDPE